MVFTLGLMLPGPVSRREWSSNCTRAASARSVLREALIISECRPRQSPEMRDTRIVGLKAQ